MCVQKNQDETMTYLWYIKIMTLTALLYLQATQGTGEWVPSWLWAGNKDLIALPSVFKI